MSLENLPSSFFRADQVRELDRIAIEELGIPGLELMKRAGRASFEELLHCWPGVKSIAIFTGVGNNAGDGFVLGLLARQHGLDVSMIQVGDGKRLKGDALMALTEYLDGGGTVQRWLDGAKPAHQVDLIVDAIFGTGLQREVQGEWRTAIEFINTRAEPVFALDIPSGLNADTGAVMGVAVSAQLTITFIGLKQGMFTGVGRDFCGDIKFNRLDIPNEVFLHVKPAATRVGLSVLHSLLTKRNRASHKGDNGHILIVGGGPGMLGATRLAGEAALRSGAGLVTVATHPDHRASLALCRPELMCYPVDNESMLQPLLDHATVVVLGPGLGRSDWALNLYQCVLNSNKPLVLDADGLNILAQTPVKRTEWILTPHPGEAARLLDCTVKDVQGDRFKCLQQLVDQYGATVVLKGSGSLVQSVSGPTHLCLAGNPGMATGGMGDVLTGVIASLIAQGMLLSDAARIGTLIHAEAADLAAGDGERGMIASDLMPGLRQLLNSQSLVQLNVK